MSFIIEFLSSAWKIVYNQFRSDELAPEAPVEQRLESRRIEFEYQPLRGPRAFRLLLLRPNNDRSPIECLLFHEDLDHCQSPFTALSYTWGSGDRPRRIFCQGKCLYVTENLYSALRRLRKHGIKLCWIDAVCINQSNDPRWLREKEAQVRMMGDIYSQAEQVIVDLGEASENSSGALNLCMRLSGWSFRLLSMEPISATQRFWYGLPTDEDPIWKSWRALFTRPWFRRAWVLQEFALAQQLKFMCGMKLFDDETLKSAWWVAVRHELGLYMPLFDEAHLTEFMTSGRCFNAMVTLRESIQINGLRFVPSGTLLEIIRDFKVSDNRDFVYSVLSFLSDSSDPALTVDYAQSDMVLFERVARYLIGNGNGYNLLRFAGCSRERHPSWVPDFTKASGEHVRYLNRSLLPYRITPPNVCIAFVPGKDPLYAFGMAWDRVAELTRVFHVNKNGELAHASQEKQPQGLFTLRKLNEWILESWETISAGAGGDPYSDLKDAYKRTLVADCIIESHNAVLEGTDSSPSFASESSAILERTPASASFIEQFDELMSLEERLTTFLDKAEKRTGAILPAWDLIKEEKELNVVRHGYIKDAMTILVGQRLCVTARGYIGLVPEHVEVGDRICPIRGVNAPFVLREKENGYEMIEKVYIHGLMDGQAFEMPDYREQALPIV